MACVKRRRGKWVVDWKKPDGRRGWKTFDEREDADRFFAEQLRATGGASNPQVDPRITVTAYSERWLDQVEASLRRGTHIVYRSVTARHIVPRIGTRRVTDISRSMIRQLLVQSRKAGFSRNTVRGIYTALAAMLAAAVEDEIIVTNPATRALRKLGLGRNRSVKAEEEVDAMTRAQRDLLISKTRDVAPRYWPILFALSRSGLRVGEAIALRWADVDLKARALHIDATCSRGKMGPTKSGAERYVDISFELVHLLTAMKKSPERMKLGQPEWVFTSLKGHRIEYSKLCRAFKTIREAAVEADEDFPTHFTIHTLRHTYARLILEAGGDVLWLQRQMGHTSIEMTADLYGRWAVIKRPGLVDCLDSRSKDVAKGQKS